MLAAEVAAAAGRPRSARTLFLDLDGTLAPIVKVPSEAAVPPEALDAIRRLGRGGWRIVIVSGRPLAQARRMARVEGVAVFGSHGLESDSPRHALTTSATKAAIRRLKRIVGPAKALALGFPGAMLEIKPAGVAFHDRRIPAERLGEWKRRLREFLAGRDLDGVDFLRGKRVLELRPSGVHKGSVVRALAPRAAGGRRDASLLAIGDDTTDEDMFEALGGRGLAVRVGRRVRATHANRRLASPGAVAEFLARLAASRGGTRAGGGRL